MKLPQRDSKSWYRIENKASGPSQVYVYDEIGLGGITADSFIADLNQMPGEIELHLSSPGGEVFDGIAIFNAVKSRGNVHIVVDSLAASIASVIAMGGKTITMTKNAQMMIHDGFGMTTGNAQEMRKMADLLDRTSDNLASIYADRTGTGAELWRAAMRQETWYSADEAVAAGLADRIEGEGVPVRNIFNLADLGFKNAPEAVKPEAPCCPHCALTNASVDTSPWDASRAWKAGAASDDPAAYYKAICAGKKAGDPNNQSSWALPYRYSPSSAPNAAGVRNALSRLPQTEGLTNADQAKAKLQKLMKQVDPNYAPAESNRSEADSGLNAKKSDDCPWSLNPELMRDAFRTARMTVLEGNTNND